MLADIFGVDDSLIMDRGRGFNQSSVRLACLTQLDDSLSVYM